MKFKIEAESERDIKSITINVKYEDDKVDVVDCSDLKVSKPKKESKEGIDEAFLSGY